MALPLTLLRLQRLLQTESQRTTFYRVLDQIDLKTAEGGSLTAELRVREEHLNLQGTLHGGYSSTVIDVLSTFALLTKRNVNSASVELSLSFLGPAKRGDLITIEANTLKLGRTLAYLDARILCNNKIIVTAKHTKYLSGEPLLKDD